MGRGVFYIYMCLENISREHIFIHLIMGGKINQSHYAYILDIASWIRCENLYIYMSCVSSLCPFSHVWSESSGVWVFSFLDQEIQSWFVICMLSVYIEWTVFVCCVCSVYCQIYYPCVYNSLLRALWNNVYSVPFSEVFKML